MEKLLAYETFRAILQDFYAKNPALIHLFLFFFLLYYMGMGYLYYEIGKKEAYKTPLVAFIPFAKTFFKADLLGRPLLLLGVPILLGWFFFVLLISPLIPKGLILFGVTTLLGLYYEVLLLDMDKELLENYGISPRITSFLFFPIIPFFLKPILYCKILFKPYQYYEDTEENEYYYY